MFIAKNNGQIILARDTEEQLINDLQFMVYTDIEETSINYVLHNGSYITKEEALVTTKEAKQGENTLKAKQAVENGHVVFKGAEFETNAQTVGDLTATMLLMQASGIKTYLWLSKDDIPVELTVEDFGTLGALIATFKNDIWQRKYLYFKTLIENATTIEEVNSINIDYTIEWVTLTIKATPEEATVTINSEETKEATLITYQGAPAKFDYEVLAQDYITKKGTVETTENKELEVTLDKAMTDVTLTVLATPEGATVTINDIEQKSCTLQHWRDEKVTFTYKVEAKGYITIEGTEEINEDKELSVELVKVEEPVEKPKEEPTTTVEEPTVTEVEPTVTESKAKQETKVTEDTQTE